jgi:hypothetical protein
MKLDDAVYAEVCVLRESLQEFFGGVPQRAARRALSEVSTGRKTEACLDMLRSLVKLLHLVDNNGNDNCGDIEECVNIVRSKMKRDAAPFLTPEHVVAYNEICTAWFINAPMLSDADIDPQVDLCVFAFKDLARTPYIVESLERKVMDPKEVRELVSNMMQTHPAISVGAL